jgi:DNA primase
MHYNLKNSKKKRASVDIIGTLKDTVSIEEVVSMLGVSGQYGWTRSGRSLIGNCPTGHPSQSGTSFSINLTGNYFYCFNCNKGGDIISLVEIVNRIDTKAAVRWLAEKFNQSLLTYLPNSGDTNYARETAHFQHQDLFNLIFEHGKEMLHNSSDAQAVREYLTKERGYDLTLLKNTEFIYWDEEANIRKYLKDNAPEQEDQIKSLSLNGGFGDRFRLAIPFRDMHGLITGFLKRAHVPQGFDIGDRTGVRWDSTKGLTKQDPFGMHRIPRGQQTLLLVEGYPDATYLPAVGIENVIALGQAAFSEQYLSALELRGVKRLILALDNDGGTGIRNTEDICQRFIGDDIQVFVIDPPLLGAHKDPDEFVKANGVEAMKQLMEKAESSTKWLLRRILSRHNLSADLGREAALDEVFDFECSLRDPIGSKEIIDHLSQTLSIPPELLDEKIKTLHERQARRQAAAAVVQLAKEVQATLTAGDTVKAIGTLSTQSKQIALDFDRSVRGAQQPLLDLLNEKENIESQRAANSILGYPLSKFSIISKHLSGLQTGLYIIAADPNIGKTAFLLNLLLDAIEKNPDTSTVFYSMDDSRKTIVNRLLAILTQIDINTVQSKQANTKDSSELKKAYEYLRQKIAEKRLDIKDAMDLSSMDAIELDLLARENQDKLIVGIDGLFNVGVEGDQNSIRETNIERANGLKGFTQKFRMPLLATAEIRKTMAGVKKAERSIQDIMETGKFGYNADVVWIMQTADPEKAKSQSQIEVCLKFEKNKLSSFKDQMTMTFYKSKSTFSECIIR